MSPSLAYVLFLAGIAGLFWLDGDSEHKTSPAMFIPVAWMAIGGSRMVSQWFVAGTGAMTNPDQYMEGSPVDAMIVSALLAVGLAVLATRYEKCIELLRGNKPIIIFFAYCLASTLWSDFPAIAFKRWIKVFGNMSMVLVVLTDPRPALAAKRLMSWTGFVLIPMSVLIIKYYPDMGRAYDKWTGAVVFVGITESKNSLGGDYLVFGLAAFWCCVEALRNERNRVRQLLAHGTTLGMVIWLMVRVNSSTSSACFALGAGLITMMTLFGRGRPKLVHLVIGSIAFTVLFGFLNQDAFSVVAGSLGRDTTLTGRTELWDDILKMSSNRWIGSGFESFFLGDHLVQLWSKYWWHPNEAHNGYIEIYLNLGWIGIGLLAMLFVSGYRNVVAAFREESSLATLRLAVLVVAIPYNLTEAAFKVMHPMLISFLLAGVAAPKAFRAVTRDLAKAPVPSITPFRLSPAAATHFRHVRP